MTPGVNPGLLLFPRSQRSGKGSAGRLVAVGAGAGGRGGGGGGRNCNTGLIYWILLASGNLMWSKRKPTSSESFLIRNV